MTKQRPTPDKIANELRDGSAFFRTPAAAPGSPPATSSPRASAARRPPDAPARAPGPSGPPDRPGRRQMIRHGFEVYLDQLESLRRLAEAQRRRGEPGSMSKMVRDAIDHLLAERPPSD